MAPATRARLATIGGVLSTSVVVLDFETTGLSPRGGDRITEVAALRVRDGRVVDRYVTLVNAGVRIPSFITQLTGITNAMVASAPPVTRVIRELVDFLADDLVVAHNAGFDHGFLRAECARAGLADRDYRMLCTMRLARRLTPGLGSYRLSVVANAPRRHLPRCRPPRRGRRTGRRPTCCTRSRTACSRNTVCRRWIPNCCARSPAGRHGTCRRSSPSAFGATHHGTAPRADDFKRLTQGISTWGSTFELDFLPIDVSSSGATPACANASAPPSPSQSEAAAWSRPGHG